MKNNNSEYKQRVIITGVGLFIAGTVLVASLLSNKQKDIYDTSYIVLEDTEEVDDSYNLPTDNTETTPSSVTSTQVNDDGISEVEKKEAIKVALDKYNTYLTGVYELIPTVNAMVEMYYGSAVEYQLANNNREVEGLGEWILPTETNIVHDSDINTKISERSGIETMITQSDIMNYRLYADDFQNLWVKEKLADYNFTVEDALIHTNLNDDLDNMRQPANHFVDYLENVLKGEKQLYELMLELKNKLGPQLNYEALKDINTSEIESKLVKVNKFLSEVEKLRRAFLVDYIGMIDKDINAILDYVDKQFAENNKWYLDTFRAKNYSDLEDLYLTYEADLTRELPAYPAITTPTFESQFNMVGNDEYLVQLLTSAYNILQFDPLSYELLGSEIQFNTDIYGQGGICVRWEMQQNEIAETLNANIAEIRDFIQINNLQDKYPNFTFLDRQFDSIHLEW